MMSRTISHLKNISHYPCLEWDSSQGLLLHGTELIHSTIFVCDSFEMNKKARISFIIGHI